jgi:AcrR family transcriptional regulator
MSDLSERLEVNVKQGPAQPDKQKIRKRAQATVRLQPRRPRGRPKADDLEALEARLALVARQAFALHGYGATSINAIARSARVSKNTLYARFPSKAAILQAIIARQIATVGDELRSISWEASESLQDRLCMYINVALTNSLNREVLDINRLIMSESYQFPELAELSWSRFRRGVAHVAEIIEEFARRDRLPCKNAIRAAELLMYAVYGWYNSVVIANRKVSAAERTSWVAETVTIFLSSRAAW